MSGAAFARRLVLATALALVAFPAYVSAAAPGLGFGPLEAVPPRLRAEVPREMDPQRSPAPFLPVFELKASHGYRVGVIGIGSAVILEVARNHGRAITAYVARGTVTPGRLEASFGKLGRVAMRFRPSANRTWEKPHRHCKGSGRFLNRRGVYVGDVRFSGEGGYISIHAHRAKGLVSTVASQCRGVPPATPTRRSTGSRGGGGLELDFLGASWRHGVSSTSLGAIALGGKALYFATTAQSQGELAIFRFAFVSGPGRGFTADNALTRAQISPPAPFKGTGAYRAAPDGTKTWSGGLSVNFPGAPRLPLTGPQFKAELYASF